STATRAGDAGTSPAVRAAFVNHPGPYLSSTSPARDPLDLDVHRETGRSHTPVDPCVSAGGVEVPGVPVSTVGTTQVSVPAAFRSSRSTRRSTRSWADAAGTAVGVGDVTGLYTPRRSAASVPTLAVRPPELIDRASPDTTPSSCTAPK